MSTTQHTAEHNTIMVTGSREFPTGIDGAALVLDALCKATTLLEVAGMYAATQTQLIHGAARGLDELAATVVAEQLSWDIVSMPAQWDLHTEACPDWHHQQPRCRMAGHRRNGQMLDRRPDVVVGFPMHSRSGEGATGSRGTWGAIDEAVRRGIPVLVMDRSTGDLWLDPTTRDQADHPLTTAYAEYRAKIAREDHEH